MYSFTLSESKLYTSKEIKMCPTVVQCVSWRGVTVIRIAKHPRLRHIISEQEAEFRSSSFSWNWNGSTSLSSQIFQIGPQSLNNHVFWDAGPHKIPALEQNGPSCLNKILLTHFTLSVRHFLGLLAITYGDLKCTV